MKNLPFIRVLDYAVALGCLAYGVYDQSTLFIVGGVLGLGLAWYNPAGRVRNALIAKKQVSAK